MRYLLAHVDVPMRVAVMSVVFFLLFIGIVAYVYSGRRKKRYEEASELPLHEGQEVQRQPNEGNGV